ncbi:hypothetical protein [Rossellomorea aquimaris]|uniref:hypothetical protein n=1 Tax=Rossellomorea aquimaris TaxID=189382 RepID=UPI0008FCB593|nr:hypothetical protein [Rossellomorea aquimaris]
MIGVHDEDSGGKSELGETPQERMRRGGSPTARGKRSLARKSLAVIRASIEMFVSRKDHFISAFIKIGCLID